MVSMASLRGTFDDRRESKVTKQSLVETNFVVRISLRSIRSPRNDGKIKLIRDH